MQNLAAFSQKGADIGSSIHRSGKDFGMFMWRLGLANQTTQNTSQGDSLLHGTSGRSGSQSLQVERQVVLDRSRGLNWLDLESSTNVGEIARPEWQRLRVVLLPSLVLGTQVKSTRVLQVRREDDGLVPSFARTKANSSFLESRCSCVKASKRLTASRKVPAERTCSQVRVVKLANFPQKCQCRKIDIRNLGPLHPLWDVLQRGVIGVLTGLTRTLSRCN
jgi:hypothetical protein